MPAPAKRAAKRRTAKPRRGREMVHDLWHLAFADVMQLLGPKGFEILVEVLLTLEPQRADMILLRRRGRGAGRARVLRKLWGWLGQVTILEYKSPAESSFRAGDLMRLFCYGVLYDTQHLAELASPSALTLALVLPSITPTLRDEVARMGWELVPVGGGYARIDGAEYTTFVAEIDEVCQDEKDDFLVLFSRTQRARGEAAQWMRRWLTEATMKRRNMKNTQGYDEMFQKLVEAMPPEQRLAGLAPEQRLAGLAPEQRLAGLAPEREVLALSPEVLRALSEEYVRSLPADVQREIKKRLRRPRAASAAAHRA
jgi:hypothetical protein